MFEEFNHCLQMCICKCDKLVTREAIIDSSTAGKWDPSEISQDPKALQYTWSIC